MTSLRRISAAGTDDDSAVYFWPRTRYTSGVVRTWDDIPDLICRLVSDCQRQAVNLLIGDGYEIRLAWPDLNFEALDRIIIMTEKEIDPGKVAQAYVDIEGRVNGVDPYLYLAEKDYWWKELP